MNKKANGYFVSAQKHASEQKTYVFCSIVPVSHGIDILADRLSQSSASQFIPLSTYIRHIHDTSNTDFVFNDRLNIQRLRRWNLRSLRPWVIKRQS
jgi:thiamine monophosphate synthase